jgi:hypothetical protein
MALLWKRQNLTRIRLGNTMNQPLNDCEAISEFRELLEADGRSQARH